MDNQRNLILAVVLVALLLFGWDAAMQYFYPQPAQQVAEVTASDTPKTDDAKPVRTREGGLSDPAAYRSEP